MSRQAERLIAAVFGMAALCAALMQGSAPALAEPDQTSGDSGVLGAPPAGPQPLPPGSFGYPMPADPFAPPPPPVLVAPVTAPAPVPLPPFEGQPPFAPPSFDPPNGAKVGVAKPIKNTSGGRFENDGYADWQR